MHCCIRQGRECRRGVEKCKLCRYESRAYWKDVHEQSQAYKDFVQRMQDSKLEPEMDIQVFYETDIGHMCG